MLYVVLKRERCVPCVDSVDVYLRSFVTADSMWPSMVVFCMAYWRGIRSSHALVVRSIFSGLLSLTMFLIMGFIVLYSSGYMFLACIMPSPRPRLFIPLDFKSSIALLGESATSITT